MTETILAPPALAALIEQVARSIHASGFSADLFPAQWSALRYFARTDPPRRTASALARYQGLATGPVTRTVRTLVAKGLLAKGGRLGRGRSERVDLTPAGRALLARDPLAAIEAVLAERPAADLPLVAAVLEAILHRLQDPQRRPVEASGEPGP